MFKIEWGCGFALPFLIHRLACVARSWYTYGGDDVSMDSRALLPVKSDVIFRQFYADERTRDLYERREKARRDISAEKKWAIKQREFEIAQNLLKRNRPIDEIMEDTGLTREEVESLCTCTHTIYY